MPGNSNATLGKGRYSGKGLEQFALAIAGNPGDADDLSGAHLKTHSVNPRDVKPVAHNDIFNPERWFGGLRGTFFNL